MLVDIPGFAEAGNAYVSATADSGLEGGTAYLVVISYNQLGNSGDIAILTKLQMVDKGNVVL